MKYHHVISYALERPWAMQPGKLAAIQAFLSLKAAGEDVDPDEARLMAASNRSTGARSVGTIAVVPLYGILTQRGGIDAHASAELTSTTRVGDTLRLVYADPSVKAIILDVDSPGGEVFGTSELADVVAELVAADQKPIVAVANSLAASAAYWVASQAAELVVTPSGEVGSIGVYSLHQDVSKAAEMEGVKFTFVSAGKFKTEGSPFEPLGDEARAAIQTSVNDYYGLFVSAVARGRGVSVSVVRSGFGEGRVLTAKRALAEGMVDRLETLDATIDRLARGGFRKPKRGATALSALVLAQDPETLDRDAEAARAALAAGETVTLEEIDANEARAEAIRIEVELRRRRLALRR